MNDLERKRKECGLTQKEVADYLGVSRNTVYRWENGERSPKKQHLYKLEKLFSMSQQSVSWTAEKIDTLSAQTKLIIPFYTEQKKKLPFYVCLQVLLFSLVCLLPVKYFYKDSTESFYLPMFAVFLFGSIFSLYGLQSSFSSLFSLYSYFKENFPNGGNGFSTLEEVGLKLQYGLILLYGIVLISSLFFLLSKRRKLCTIATVINVVYLSLWSVPLYLLIEDVLPLSFYLYVLPYDVLYCLALGVIALKIIVRLVKKMVYIQP